MKEKLQEYLNKYLDNTIIIKFDKFRYGSEDASCTSFINEDEIANRIDHSYLDESFDDAGNDNLDFQIRKCRTHKIDDFINKSKTETNFHKLLFKYIDDKNLKDSDVYNKVHIDRRLFSKIRSDVMYHPSKETVILLGLSLELNEEQVEELLNSASYSLPKNNVYDLIIRFCFVEGIYELKKVNELLDSYNCKLFLY